MTSAQLPDEMDEISGLALRQDPVKTFGGFLEEKWRAVCRGLGTDPRQTETVLGDLREVLHPWGARPVGTHCEPPSFVSADGFPAELSVSWKAGRPEVRVLFESLGSDGTPLGCQEAGRELTRRLAASPGTDIARYLSIEDLFLTSDPERYRATLWHSLAWRPGHRPHYKVYLNPQVNGLDRAYEVMAEAMHRLGLADAWRPVAERGRELAKQGHELELMALDLDAGSTSRVKVYYRHLPMEMEELDAVAALAHRYEPERAARARSVIYGRDGGTVSNEPMTCLAFREGAPGPEEANLYLRLPDNARDDTEAAARVARLMDLEGVDPRPLAGVLRELGAGGPGVTGMLQELCSYRTISPRTPADIGLYLRFSTYAGREAGLSA
ncbi:tryptophan dimethylallyltransferase family protein [Streptomyces sp. DSM 15324]|uniref:tryptophan dimethylallyltransferase family protein n=1 Tax=Streptomyces sp. DSM 15324 TaxID=1739111 RepID=UPI000AF20B54|nr:tryptophan dimethylallyltransferase family protein [Streptomyces sp. DSM 15324]